MLNQEVHRSVEENGPHNLNIDDILLAYDFSKRPPSLRTSVEKDAVLEGGHVHPKDVLSQVHTDRPADLARIILRALENTDLEDLKSGAKAVDIYHAIWNLLKRCINEPDGEELTEDYLAARKVFALSLVETLDQRFSWATTASELKEVELLCEKIDSSMLGTSPNIIDYIGTFEDIFEVAVAAQRVPPLERMVWEATEISMQGLAFSNNKEEAERTLVESVSNASPVNQLNTLKFYDSMGRHAYDVSYGETADLSLQGVFQELAGSGNALTGIMSARYFEDLAQGYQPARDDSYDKDQTAFREHYSLGKYFTHSGFAPDAYVLTQVARDVVGLKDKYGVLRTITRVPEVILDVSQDEIMLRRSLDLLLRCTPRLRQGTEAQIDAQLYDMLQDPTTKDGLRDAYVKGNLAEAITSLLATDGVRPKEVGFEATIAETLTASGALPDKEADETGALLQAIHQPVVRETLERQLGVSLAELNLKSQVCLLHYLVQRNPEEFNRLTSSAHALIDAGEPVASFYEAFLVTEFGDDMGETIVGLAETAAPREALKIMNEINTYREQARRFCAWFSAYDKQFAMEAERSFNDRLGELLVAGKAIAKNGTLDEPVLYADQRLKINSLSEYIDILQQFGECFRQMADTMDYSDVKAVTADDTKGYSLYLLKPKNTDGKQLSFYLRPRGVNAYSYDKLVEYGSKFGKEASMSIALNPVPGESEIGLTIADREDELSIRFDREGVPPEGLAPGENPDPTRVHGTASLDIGSIFGAEDNFGTIIGRLVAVGNKLRAEGRGTSVSYNHNRQHFTQEVYGDAGRFDSLVHRVGSGLRSKKRTHQRRIMGQGVMRGALLAEHPSAVEKSVA